MATQQEIDSFADFASQQNKRGGGDLTMEELFGLWQAQSLPAAELADSVAAIKASYADMESGDTGIPVDQHLATLRMKYGITDDK